MASRAVWVWTVAFALCACAGGGPRATIPSAPKIVFDETRYDGGPVDAGTKVVHAYRFTNAGGLDLVVDNVRTSCGCAAAVTPSRAVPPGGDGAIVVEF